MAIVNKPLTELLREIEGEECIFEDVLNPEQNPDTFVDVSAIGGGSVRIPSGEYRGELMKRISPEYKPTGYTWVAPPGYDSCLTEMLINAFERGKPPVTIKLFKGQKGHVLRIKDSGEGFAHEALVAEMRAGSEDFYQRNGGGLRTFERKPYQISYESNGNIINMQILAGQ
jgi:hypothetical protein